MSQTLERIDPVYITETIRKEWNGWNFQQRTLWVMMHELPLLPLGASWAFDDLPEQVRDALFVEYCDNAKRDMDWNRFEKVDAS